MRVECPLGHEQVIQGLWRAARRERLGHALLFSGPDGIGKFVAAQWLAAGILCERGPGEPCGVCGSCKRVRADSHADVFIIDADDEGEEQIKLERITPRDDGEGPSVLEFLTLRAREGGWRIVLMRDAERLTGEAQNALLKMLEEPGERVLFVLTSAHEERLFATTLSRLVRVRFLPLDPAPVNELLRAQGMSADEALLFARWSRGSPGRARALRARGARECVEIFGSVARGAEDAAAAAMALAELEGEWPAGTPTAQLRARVRTILDLLLELYLERERLHAGRAPGALAFGAELERWPGTPDSLRRSALDRCLEARQDVDRNLSPELCLERALDTLARRVLARPAPTT